jgi:cell division septation protein DedD
LTPAPAKLEPAPAPSKSEPALEQLPPTSKAANVLNFQIGALRKSADAERLLSDVKKKGFKGFILSPHDESNPYYRVQVGPFKDPIEAEKAKKNLEAAGFKPMLKK